MINRQTKSESSLGNQFHQFAGASLLSLGFSLVGDPRILQGRYSDSWAMYKLKGKGFFLKVAFQLVEGNVATVSCGRDWFINDRHYGLSNTYAVLAKQFAFDVPGYYELGDGEARQLVQEKILDDLLESLGVVVLNVTLEDILYIENVDGGMLLAAKNYYGSEYAEHVVVNDFNEVT